MDHSTIRSLPPKIEGKEIHWTGEMKSPAGVVTSVYFNFTCPDSSAFVPRVRPFLLAFLAPAMRVGFPVQMEQPLDQTTWHNLMEWQSVMASWFPKKYRVVPILCPIAPEPPKAVRQPLALTAFSGGVDSCFTAFQHTITHEAGHHRQTPLGAGLMVHGFDIPESQPEVFDSAFQRSKFMLDSFGLQSYRMRTNIRTLGPAFDCQWSTETHGIWLAAALACLDPFFGRLLIPSSYPYEILRLPWGSSPVTDVLLGSETSPVWHDGAAFHKLSKVQAIALHPDIQRRLRVCWAGTELDRNCGRCFKCVATQVSYWLSGVPRPECFHHPCRLADVACTPLKTASNRHLFQLLFAEADRQASAGLARALAAALRRNTLRRLRRKLKQLCLHPQDFLDQL